MKHDILRVWQIPVERLLKGGLATLPLAFLSDVNPSDLPALVERIEHRLERRPERRLAPDVWTASFVLLGTRYTVALARQLLGRFSQMIESVTYQAIVEEGMREGMREGERQGELKGVRKTLLAQGHERFGAPSRKAAGTLQAINDLTRLEFLSRRILQVQSWEELLDLPRPRRKARE
jgi:predicted transposase YdaD